MTEDEQRDRAEEAYNANLLRCECVECKRLNAIEDDRMNEWLRREYGTCDPPGTTQPCGCRIGADVDYASCGCEAECATRTIDGAGVFYCECCDRNL